MTNSPLSEVVAAQKRGEAKGIYAIYAANRFVLEAGMKQALQDGSPLLIESTCNQVNQYGGYTGITPPHNLWLTWPKLPKRTISPQRSWF